MKMGSTNKTMGKNEVRVNYSASGIQRNQSDIDRIKKAQKNFIDKYNKGRMFNKIKYNVNKKGTYDIIKPKKK